MAIQSIQFSQNDVLIVLINLWDIKNEKKCENNLLYNREFKNWKLNHIKLSSAFHIACPMNSEKITKYEKDKKSPIIQVKISQ